MSGLKQYSVGIICAAALFSAGLAGSRLYILREATKLIEELKNLDKAPDPTALSFSLMRKYNDRRTTEYCRDNFCQYEFLFTNGLVSVFHLAPRGEIQLYFSLYKGSLEMVNVQYTSAVFKANSPIVHVQEDFCAGRTDIKCNHFDLNPHGRDVTPSWNGSVEFGQLAKEEQKRSAWTFNFDCMVALKGCKNIAELLPTIWKLTSPRTVSSRIRSTADSIAEASQPLPNQ